jgi:beta-lactamase regulating signal transducer with metallopeptidase domain
MVGLLIVPAAYSLGQWQIRVNRPVPPRAAPALAEEPKPASGPAQAQPVAATDARIAPIPAAESRVGRSAVKLRLLSVWAGERTQELILAGWCLGTIILLLRSGFLLARIRRIRTSSLPAGPQSQSLLDRVARELKCTERVLLRLSPNIASPFLTGMRRPVIILPERMGRPGYENDLPGILAHEVAHVRAHDLYWMLLARSLSTLLWFHPLAWRMRAAHSTACEEVCDAVAADYVGNAALYSSSLARVALAIVRPVPSVGGIPMARSSQIISRVQLLEHGVRPNPIRRGRLFLCAAFGIALLAGVASVRLVDAQETPKPKGAAPGGSAPSAQNEVATQKLAPAVLERRTVNKKVADFPAKLKFFTPEAVAVAIIRATARQDAETIVTHNEKSDPRLTVGLLNAYWARWKQRDPAGFAAYNEALLGAEIVEVDTEAPPPSFSLGLALVYARLPLPKGSAQSPLITIVCCGPHNNYWWYDGEAAPAASLEEARAPLEAKPPLERREINKQVADFPDKPDFSTPESAMATYLRGWATQDAKSLVAGTLALITQAEFERDWKKVSPEDLAKARQRCLATKIVEVFTDRGQVAVVIASAPRNGDSDSYERTNFILASDGQWEEYGDGKDKTLEAAVAPIEAFRDYHWLDLHSRLRTLALAAQVGPVTEPVKIILPAEAMDPVKAELVGRIELSFALGQRDVTARKTIAWSDVTRDAKGNRSIQYEAYITVWDKDKYITKDIYTFDSNNNLIGVKHADGYPQKVVPAPVDIGTQEGLKALVEKFFSQNYVDIASRETMEWGPRETKENGDVSIRYMYKATLRHGEKTVMNQVFTFSPKGEYVSNENVKGYPKEPSE